jgi:hypothetical protein
MAELNGKSGKKKACKPFENPGGVISLQLLVNVLIKVFIFPSENVFENLYDDLCQG